MVMPLAASARYLIYARAAEKADGRPARTGGIYYRTAHGEPHLLTTRSHVATSWAYLAGAMAIYFGAGDTPGTLSWRNLHTGAHGRVADKPSLAGGGTSNTTDLVAAAPNGWIIQKHETDKPDLLYLQTTKGKSTNLGAPEPAGRGSHILTLRTSSTALVVYNDIEGNNNGSAVVMKFERPGVFRRFVPVNRSHVTSCPNVTTKYIACSVEGRTVHRFLRLFTTGGHLIIATRPRCDGVVGVMGNSLAWLSTSTPCQHHELFTLSRHNTLRTAKGPFDTGGLSGLGGLILTRGKVVTGWDREIVLVTDHTHERVLISET